MIENSGLHILAVSVWVIVGNIWHIVLLTQRRGEGRPVTISEHAVEASRLLWIHRIVHSLPLLVFPPLAFNVLLPQKYYVAGILLLIAAVFDSLQALTLNKQTAPLEYKFNLHSVTAWVMALSYFAYSGVISQIAGVPSWLIAAVLLVCMVLLVCAGITLFKRRFLVMQMSNFVLLSSLGLLAHRMLIVS